MKESEKEPIYKRPLDLAIFLFAHILLCPFWLLLWAIIPALICLEDGRPIFYFQRRVGKGGRVFKAIKFRSMVRDAEKYTGPVWAKENDSRVTRVGRLLRVTALDELPQVLNILRGDMSFVGPRPERPELMRKFSQEIPDFPLRLKVRPGLTGPAQVYGNYDSHPRKKLRYDLFYIKNMSPWFDIKLLFLSLYVTLKGKWETRSRKF